MNRRRRICLAVGAVMLALVGLFPPWRQRLSQYPVFEPLPNAFLFRPTRGYGAVEIDWSRLAAQWAVVALITGAVTLALGGSTSTRNLAGQPRGEPVAATKLAAPRPRETFGMAAERLVSWPIITSRLAYWTLSALLLVLLSAMKYLASPHDTASATGSVLGALALSATVASVYCLFKRKPKPPLAKVVFWVVVGACALALRSGPGT